jgi:hypothetical protein
MPAALELQRTIMKKIAIWLNILVGVLWIGIGLTALLGSHFLSFNGRVVSNGTAFFDVAAGVTFLCVGLVFYFVSRSAKVKSRDLRRQT